jgi:pimeloyl-ACP methyl ester carboxylesterase
MEAVPVVFLHGIRLSGTALRPIAELVGADRPVATPDLPGHGTRRGEPFTLDGAVGAVTDAVDGLGGSALLVGHSLGGYVGIATAGRHPGRVAALVGIGCTYLPRGGYAAGFRVAARLAAARPEISNRLSAWGYRRTLPPPVAEAVLAGGLGCEIMPQVVDAITAQDPLESLRAYPGAVWFVNGTRDRGHEKQFLGACRNGRVTLLPRRGHISCLAEPAVLARIVTEAAAQTG